MHEGSWADLLDLLHDMIGSEVRVVISEPTSRYFVAEMTGDLRIPVDLRRLPDEPLVLRLGPTESAAVTLTEKACRRIVIYPPRPGSGAGFLVEQDGLRLRINESEGS